MLITIQETHGLFLVIPVLNRREDPDREYAFHTQDELAAFVAAWMRDPYTAAFDYEIKHNAAWVAAEYENMAQANDKNGEKHG